MSDIALESGQAPPKEAQAEGFYSDLNAKGKDEDLSYRILFPSHSISLFLHILMSICLSRGHETLS